MPGRLPDRQDSQPGRDRRKRAPGEGMFICAIRRRLARAGVSAGVGAEIPADEHDLLAELGITDSVGTFAR
jgi:hypothetical protein